MKNKHQIELTDQIEFGEMNIVSIKEKLSNIQISYAVHPDFPVANFLKIKNKEKVKTLNFEKHVTIDLLDVVHVECQDWFGDENISKSSINQPNLRWNDAAEDTEYKVSRTIGDGLTEDYINFIDLEFAKIASITNSFYEGVAVFQVVLAASYSLLSEKNELLDFHTGPFHFYCKQIEIVID